MKAFLVKLKLIMRTLPIRRIINRKDFKIENSLIIFAEARTGSTWLMELLAHAKSVCTNWEPLHLNSSVLPKSFNFGWRTYLDENEGSPEYKTFFHNSFTLKEHNWWTLSYNRKENIGSAEYVLTKFVRANLMAPYLLRTFSFKYRPILLIRHPLDVCISQIGGLKNEAPDETTYSPPSSINAERFVQHQVFYQGLKTKLEKTVALWCINNVGIINRLPKLESKLIIVFYNDLIGNPRNEINRILSHWPIVDEQDIESFLDSLPYRKASTTGKNYEKGDFEKQLYKNFKALDEEKKDRIQNIFDHFKLELFDMKSPYPNIGSEKEQ